MLKQFAIKIRNLLADEWNETSGVVILRELFKSRKPNKPSSPEPIYLFNQTKEEIHETGLAIRKALDENPGLAASLGRIMSGTGLRWPEEKDNA